MEIVIDSEKGLHSALARLRDSNASWAYQLQLSDLSPEENNSMQERINRLASACGCGSAAVASLLVTSGYLVHVIGAGLESSGALVAVIITSMVLFLLSGGIGKIAGVLYSQWRLRRTLTELIGRVTLADKH